MNHTESGNILAGESDQNASSVKELYYSQFLGDGQPSQKNSRNVLKNLHPSLEPTLKKAEKKDQKIVVVEDIDGKI